MVRLRGHPGGKPVEPAESWPAVGRPIPTRWSLTGSPFDIVAYLAEEE